jgi:hypothetical protein
VQWPSVLLVTKLLACGELCIGIEFMSHSFHSQKSMSSLEMDIHKNNDSKPDNGPQVHQDSAFRSLDVP